MYFQSLLTDEQVANAPVLILGNKIDKPGAGSEDEIRHHFGLHGQTTGKVGITHMTIRLSHPYHLDESIFMGIRSNFSFSFQ